MSSHQVIKRTGRETRKDLCPKGHLKDKDNLRLKPRVKIRHTKAGEEYEYHYYEYRCRQCDNFYKHRKRFETLGY